jgi:hypothetical protein
MFGSCVGARRSSLPSFRVRRRAQRVQPGSPFPASTVALETAPRNLSVAQCKGYAQWCNCNNNRCLDRVWKTRLEDGLVSRSGRRGSGRGGTERVYEPALNQMTAAFAGSRSRAVLKLQFSASEGRICGESGIDTSSRVPRPLPPRRPPRATPGAKAVIMRSALGIVPRPGRVGGGVSMAHGGPARTAKGTSTPDTAFKQSPSG